MVDLLLLLTAPAGICIVISIIVAALIGYMVDELVYPNLAVYVACGTFLTLVFILLSAYYSWKSKTDARRRSKME